MSHLFRFFAEPVPGTTDWRLDADESLHLAKVLRIGVGAAVEVTDGRGKWASGTVTSIGSSEAVVTCGETHVDPAPTLRLEFAVGALKPGSIDDILPALTELGLDAVHVFHQDESAKARLAPKVVERWGRILRSSVKQSKRSWIPELKIHGSLAELLKSLQTVESPRSLDAVAKSVRSLGEKGPVPSKDEGQPVSQSPRSLGEGGPLRLVLTPGAPSTVAALLTATRPTSVLALAGGEKGLTASELAALMTAGFQPARLGPHILRAVTAAIATASILAIHREDFQTSGAGSGVALTTGRPPC